MKKLFLIYILIFLITGCSSKTQDTLSVNVDNEPSPVITTPAAHKAILTPAEKEHQVYTVTITAVGDLMFHEYQLARSYDKANDSFNFDDSFTNVIPYLKEADFTIGNLETTLAGAYNSLCLGDSPIAGFSGYPCFNTPDVVAGTIKNAGFDLLTTANNHALDSGLNGLNRTLQILDKYQLLHVGTYSSQKNADNIQVVKLNNITFAFISMTYATNGLKVPDDAPYCINTLDLYSPKKETQMCRLVRDAKKQNPDFIIVMPHFGKEYKDTQDSYQEEFTNALFSAGADIILGSHPHVLEPIDIKDITREDGTKTKGFVIYSMGNFISSQQAEVGINKDLGVILTLDFEKRDSEKAIITGFSLIPTYTNWTKDTISVLPVDKTLEQIETNTLTMPKYDVNRMEFAQTYSVKHLMSYLDNYPIKYENHRYYIDLK